MKTKQIITIVGIIILLASLGIGAYFAYDKGLIGFKADPAIQPDKVHITNINHDRFSVYWVTQNPTNGSLIYGKTTKLDQMQIDDGDQLTGQQVARRIHHITVSGLDPETIYNFKIRSGEKNTIFDNQGTPFTVTTAPILSSQPTADLINGTVFDENQKPATDSVIYITMANMSPISTQVKRDGSWLVNLAAARDEKLTDYVNYDPEKLNYEILVQGSNKTSKVSISTANDSPVPQIILGETYDFTKQVAEIPEATPIASESAQLASQFPMEPETETATQSGETLEQFSSESSAIEFSNPFEEYDELTSTKPEFRGSGPAGKVLSLSIDGEEAISTSTTVNSNGVWTYTPNTALTPGSYTIEISYIDDNDDPQSIERNFIIADPGTGGNTTPAYTASISAKTTPTPISTKSAVRKSMPSTTSGVPTSGVELPTLMMLFLGIGLVLTGSSWKQLLKIK